MKRIIILVIISLVAISRLFPQEEVDLKETFLEAEYYVLYDDYEEALSLYMKLINSDFINAYINHRIGECFLHIPGKKQKSIPYLEEAIKDISTDYKEGSFKETKAPVRTLFYLGEAYQINNQLDKAIETYEKFKLTLEVEDIYNIDYVDQQIQSCRNAKELMAHPLRIKKTNIGKPINDAFSNINAVISSDEESMLFISKLKFYDAILFSQKEGDKWSNPVNINSDIRSDGEFYPCYVSMANNTLILHKYERYDGDIYISTYRDGKWQRPKKLNRNINSKFFETHASMSSDGKTLFFVSDRKEGYGGFDIYKSEYNETTNDWDVPINLGPQINTPLDEETPQLSEDGQTLYFSSQGHYNMGGFDVFYSSRIDENEWSTPVNMGYPINTTDDEVFFYPVKNGQYAYISVYDREGFGQKDIYRYEFFTPEHPFLVNVHGTVSLQDNQTNFTKSNFQVDVLDSSKVEVIQQLHLDENTGHFSTELSPGSYRFIFKSTMYKQLITTVSIPENYSRDELVFDVELIPHAVVKGEYVSIKSIYFGFDDHSLSKESKIELERLINLMRKYPSLQIEVIGHTDTIGSPAYNKILSIKRAESAINYFIEKGIEPNRVVAKGEGLEHPIAINTNPDGSDNRQGRKYNRRIEMKILKSDDKIILIEDHNIPEHLLAREFSYCILLSKEKQELPEDYFKKFEELKSFEIKKQNTPQGYLYTLGDFKKKSELVSIFNTILELGFKDAEIVSNYDIEKLSH